MANLLPEDFIVFEIVARLPLKSLVRLTLICKRWRFLITSIEFHVANASYNSHNSPSLLIDWVSNGYSGGISIVNKDVNNVLITHINDSIIDSCEQMYSFYKPAFEANGIYYTDLDKTASVIGSVNGLVCFGQNIPYPFFFIWNPVTKMFKSVKISSTDSSEWIRYRSSGFYYDSVDRDFRIIYIGRYELRSELGSVCVRVKVYSCKLDTWTEIIDDSLPNSEFYIAGFFNGRVYVHFYSKPSVLVAFDVHDEVFKRLPIPQHYVESEEEDAKHRPYINWQDSLGIVLYKEPSDPEAAHDKNVVYIYDEATCTWIEKYIAPDALDSYWILHGSENGDIVVEEYRSRNPYGFGLENGGNVVEQNIILNFYQLLLGLGNGGVVKESTGIFKLFEPESSRFKILTKLSASSEVDVRSYTESMVCINGMQHH